MQPKNRPLLILIAIIAGIVAAAHIGKISVALPFILFDLNISTVSTGYLLSIFSISAVVLCLVVGMVVSDKNVIFLIAIGFAFLSFGGFWGSASAGYSSFLVSRVLEGVGFVLIIVSAPYLISVSTSAQSRKGAMLFWGIALPSGIALGILLFWPYLGNELWEAYWQAIATLASVFCIGMLCLHWHEQRIMIPSLTISWPAQGFEFRKYKSVVLLAVAFFIYNLQNLAIVAWLGKLAIDYLNLLDFNLALLSSSIIFMNVIGNLLAFVIRDKVRLTLLLMLVQAGMAVAILCFFIIEPPLWKLPFLYVFSFFGGMLPGTLMSHVPLYMKSEKDIPKGIGLLVLGDNLGALAGPTVFAYAVFFADDWWGFAVVPCVALAAMIMVSLMLNKSTVT